MKSYYVVMESGTECGKSIRKSLFRKAKNDVELITELTDEEPNYIVLFFKELDVNYD